MKLFYVDNNASHYRKAIYLLMDQSFDVDFLFGQSLNDIKQMDTSVLRGNVEMTRSYQLLGNWYWQKGVFSKVWKKYDRYLLIGDSYSLSTWFFSFFALLLGKRKRLFFWTHGWYGKESWLQRIVKKIYLRMPGGGVFLYGNYARNLMIEQGFTPNKLFVIHNSLDHDHQLAIRQHLHLDDVYVKHFTNNNQNLLFVGRLTKVKKLDMVLLAMSHLKKKGQRFNFTLIGDGEKKQELESLTNKLGLKDNVWFYGACYDEKSLGLLIYNADLCVSPGNVGLTAMHVMVFGTPVLTHNDFPYQMPEFEAVHDGVTGAFFKRDDMESLSTSIVNWFDNNGNKRELVRNACFNEIDTQWTPEFQIKVLKYNLENNI